MLSSKPEALRYAPNVTHHAPRMKYYKNIIAESRICMPRVIAGFVESATLAPGAAECLDDAFVMPFFVDFTGPAP